MTFQPLANAKLATRPFEAADARPLFEQRLETMRQKGVITRCSRLTAPHYEPQT